MRRSRYTFTNAHPPPFNSRHSCFSDLKKAALKCTSTRNRLQVNKLEDGIEYQDVKTGTGAEVKPGSLAVAHWRVTLDNGLEVIDTRIDGKPVYFRVVLITSTSAPVTPIPVTKNAKSLTAVLCFHVFEISTGIGTGREGSGQVCRWHACRRNQKSESGSH